MRTQQDDTTMLFHRREKTSEAPVSKVQTLRDEVIAALHMIFDPEIPVNIYDLGLIYHLAIDPNGDVDIAMTLTAPGCPVAQTFPSEVEAAVRQVEGVRDCRVELVWDPPWTRDRMSEAARLQLDMW